MCRRRCAGIAVVKHRINVHLYPTAMTHESRIFKETAALASIGAFDHIVLVGARSGDLPEQEAIDARREIVRLSCSGPSWLAGSAGKAVGVLAWSLRVAGQLAGSAISCINCHSLPTLPLGVYLKARTGARLVYDAHELETETNGLGGLRRRASKIVERLLIRFVDETIVVSEGIADWYSAAYSGRRPAVVLNCPPAVHRPVASDRLRAALDLPDDAILFLYQGVFGAGRGIELLLDAFAALGDPRKVLVMMGMGPLEALIESNAGRYPWIRLHPAVTPEVLTSYTASADVGLCMIEDTCLSYRLCMPNKLFEYLGAGVPAIVSDLPEIRRVVEQHEAGWIVPEWTSRALRDVVEGIGHGDLAAYKARAARAGQVFTWERQLPALYSPYERMGFIRDPQLQADGRRTAAG